jgi:hypothetical protein
MAGSMAGPATTKKILFYVLTVTQLGVVTRWRSGIKVVLSPWIDGASPPIGFDIPFSTPAASRLHCEKVANASGPPAGLQPPATSLPVFCSRATG